MHQRTSWNSAWRASLPVLQPGRPDSAGPSNDAEGPDWDDDEDADEETDEDDDDEDEDEEEEPEWYVTVAGSLDLSSSASVH